MFAKLTGEREYHRSLITVAIYAGPRRKGLFLPYNQMQQAASDKLAPILYSIVTTMRYIHATDQGKRGAIVVLSEYWQQHCRKFVTSEPLESLPSALTR